MSLPSKKVIEIQENVYSHEFKMLNHVSELIFNNDKCIECDFCAKVCPKECIGSPEDMEVEPDLKRYVDIDTCIFCGICCVMCSGFALNLRINGESDKILLKENGSLPEIKAKELTIEETGQKIQKLVEGTTKIESTEKKVKIIEKFVKECVVGALSNKGTEIILDKDQCINCFKCQKAAEKDYSNINVEVTRARIPNEGEVSSVWKRITEALLGLSGAVMDLEGPTRKKMAEQVLKLLGKQAK